MRRLGPRRVDCALSVGLTAAPLQSKTRVFSFCAVEGQRHSLVTQLQMALYGSLVGLGWGATRPFLCGAFFPTFLSRPTFGPTYWAWVGGLGR